MTPEENAALAPAIAAPSGYISNPFNLIKPAYEAFKVNGRSYVLGILAWIGVAVAAALIGGLAIFLAIKIGGNTGNTLGFFIGLILLLAFLYVAGET